MTTAPSIKGSALSSVVEDVRRLRDEGRLGADELEARLEAADLALIDAKIQAALWYPIDGYRRLSELLLDVEGGGDPEYLVARGAHAAERLWAAGLYVQLQHGEQRAEAARRGTGVFSERDARLITTLSAAIFNFTRWAYRVEGGESRIEVTEAGDWPEVAVLASRGFLQCVVGRLRGIETTIVATRPAPDRVEFRYPLTL
jgi:hypothetical protein